MYIFRRRRITSVSNRKNIKRFANRILRTTEISTDPRFSSGLADFQIELNRFRLFSINLNLEDFVCFVLFFSKLYFFLPLTVFEYRSMSVELLILLSGNTDD